MSVLALVVPAALIALAVVLAVTGLHERRDASALSGGRTTTGTVLAATTLCGHVCDHRAVVGYTVGGASYRIIGAPQDATPQIGQRVRVSYSPSDPSVARDLDAHRSITTVLLAGAALFAVLALGALVGLGWVAVALGRRR